MSKLDEMVKRYQELEQIAMNNPDPTIRNDAMDERLNLYILIQKERAVDASQAIAELVSDDPQQQFEKQQARIAADQAHTAKVDEVLEAMAAAETAYAAIPTSNQQARERAMERILSLRLQLGKLQTVTEAV